MAEVAVRESPILFSGGMVRAILDGTKTQTRRVITDRNSIGNVKPSRCDLSRAWVDPGPSPAGNAGPYLKAPVVVPEDVGIVERIYPDYWGRLWVRETLCVCGDGLEYAADDALLSDLNPRDTKACDLWNRYAHEDGPDLHPTLIPSIFVPRWASRISLEITAVRVQRVQDITPGDACAEGIAGPITKDGRLSKYGLADVDGLPGGAGWPWQDWRISPVDAYERLWNGINAKRGCSWNVNPWVWVIEFRRCAR